MTLNVKSDKVYTRHGVPISVTGIAQVGSYVFNLYLSKDFIDSCSRKKQFFFLSFVVLLQLC